MRLMRAIVAAIVTALVPFAVVGTTAMVALSFCALAFHLTGTAQDPHDVALAGALLLCLVLGAIAGVDTYRNDR